MGKQLFIKTDNVNTESPSLFKWFRKRTLDLNKNVIMAVVGSPGAGKSYLCLRIGEKMGELNGRPFDIRNCSRDLEEFMERVNAGELKTGDVLILEEVGVNISSRDWAAKVNKLINYVFQTFRDKNLVVLLNVPDIRMLDSNTQRILHGVIQPKGVDVKRKICKLMVKLRQHNFQNHKDYWKFLRVMNNRKVKKIKSMILHKPSDELCAIYEERRSEFTDQLNKRVAREITEENEKKVLKNSPFKNPRHYKVWRLFQDYKTQFGEEPSQKDLSKVLGKTPSGLSHMTTLMDKKNPEWRNIPRK